ncbi:MAG: hypothetical protein HFK07_01285 [Clostridia bacterium]|jgi:hypothetical protein|nr:hypothetical protein [Clostridia bacterium]
MLDTTVFKATVEIVKNSVLNINGLRCDTIDIYIKKVYDALNDIYYSDKTNNDKKTEF